VICCVEGHNLTAPRCRTFYFLFFTRSKVHVHYKKVMSSQKFRQPA